MLRRSPHGERGLKFEDGDYDFEVTKSLSSRRAWIEIQNVYLNDSKAFSRSPHGERGLKYLLLYDNRQKRLCRSPHGERGLKYTAFA